MQHWHKLGVFSIKVVRCFLSNVRANLGLATTNTHKIQQEEKENQRVQSTHLVVQIQWGWIWEAEGGAACVWLFFSF